MTLDEALARIAALERKNETLRNAWQTSETDRLAAVKRAEELEREVARLTEPRGASLLMTSHSFRGMLDAGKEHLCSECGQPVTYLMHRGPWDE
jgi:hypothetical protein